MLAWIEKQNLSGNCWRRPSDKCRKLVLQPTYFALVTAILKDKQSSTDTIRPFVLSPPIKNKQYHAPDELVHAALKAKVTSHYDLRVKVSLHTLPAWLTFPASLSTVCRGHTPAEKKTPSLNQTQRRWPVWCWNPRRQQEQRAFPQFCALGAVFPDKTDPWMYGIALTSAFYRTSHVAPQRKTHHFSVFVCSPLQIQRRQNHDVEMCVFHLVFAC